MIELKPIFALELDRISIEWGVMKDPEEDGSFCNRHH